MREKLTPKMRAHLIELRDCGPGPRPPRSNVDYLCASRGYSEWLYQTHDGERCVAAQIIERFGVRWWGRAKILNVEAITPAGRRALLASDGGGDV